MEITCSVFSFSNVPFSSVDSGPVIHSMTQQELGLSSEPILGEACRAVSCAGYRRGRDGAEIATFL